MAALGGLGAGLGIGGLAGLHGHNFFGLGLHGFNGRWGWPWWGWNNWGFGGWPWWGWNNWAFGGWWPWWNTAAWWPWWGWGGWWPWSFAAWPGFGLDWAFWGWPGYGIGYAGPVFGLDPIAATIADIVSIAFWDGAYPGYGYPYYDASYALPAFDYGYDYGYPSYSYVLPYDVTLW